MNRGQSESQDIVREFKRSKRLPPGTGVRLLAGFTIRAYRSGIGGYMVVSLPMRNEGEEKHCFTDFRNWFMRRKAEFLGIDPNRLSDLENKTEDRRPWFFIGLVISFNSNYYSFLRNSTQNTNNNNNTHTHTHTEKHIKFNSLNTDHPSMHQRGLQQVRYLPLESASGFHLLTRTFRVSLDPRHLRMK